MKKVREQTGKRGGFTLLELLMVVIIIAILASLAVPQYIKTVEKARMAEAIAMLGQIRNSQIRFKVESGVGYTTNLLNLDFGSGPADVSGTPGFVYSGVSGDATGFVVAATRVAGAAGGNCIDGYVLCINSLGTILGRTCQNSGPTCPNL